MTETVVTRLTKALDPWAPGAEQDTIRLARTDGKALLQIIADYCENDPDTDHTTCAGCDAILCTSCGLGEEESTCQDDSGVRHCTSCWHDCRTCAAEVAFDARVEAYADAHGLRY